MGLHKKNELANNRNLILTGFMGTGKTAVGRVLAGRLGRTFLDTDKLVEEAVAMPVSHIFEQWGEEYFRELESKALDTLTSYSPGTLVVATGGGVVLKRENMDSLESHGLIILLTASPTAIIRRTRGETRPLLNGSAPRQRVLALLENREPYYRRHHLRVDTTGKSPDRVAAAIINQLEMMR